MCRRGDLLKGCFMVCLALRVTYAGDWLGGTGAYVCGTTQMDCLLWDICWSHFLACNCSSGAWWCYCSVLIIALVRKKDAYTQFSLNLSPWVPLFVCWMFAIGGKKLLQIIEIHCFSADGFFVFYTFLNIQHILQVLALYYFSTPEVKPRVDRAALLALCCCTHIKRQ